MHQDPSFIFPTWFADAVKAVKVQSTQQLNMLLGDSSPVTTHHTKSSPRFLSSTRPLPTRKPAVRKPPTHKHSKKPVIHPWKACDCHQLQFSTSQFNLFYGYVAPSKATLLHRHEYDLVADSVRACEGACEVVYHPTGGAIDATDRPTVIVGHLNSVADVNTGAGMVGRFEKRTVSVPVGKVICSLAPYVHHLRAPATQSMGFVAFEARLSLVDRTLKPPPFPVAVNSGTCIGYVTPQTNACFFSAVDVNVQPGATLHVNSPGDFTECVGRRSFLCRLVCKTEFGMDNILVKHSCLDKNSTSDGENAERVRMHGIMVDKFHRDFADVRMEVIIVHSFRTPDKIGGVTEVSNCGHDPWSGVIVDVYCSASKAS